MNDEIRLPGRFIPPQTGHVAVVLICRVTNVQVAHVRDRGLAGFTLWQRGGEDSIPDRATPMTELPASFSVWCAACGEMWGDTAQLVHAAEASRKVAGRRKMFL